MLSKVNYQIDQIICRTALETLSSFNIEILSQIIDTQTQSVSPYDLHRKLVHFKSYFSNILVINKLNVC
jgi:hypothetical protein